jgi:CheY-like chemotaxis protein
VGDETRPGSRRLLLIDPGPTLRTVVRLHLAPAGYEVAEVPGAPDALGALRAGTAELAIARASEGLSFAEALRRADDPRLRDVPVLLIANPGGEAALARARELGARVLIAPVTGPRLAAAVAAMLGDGG